MSDLGSEDAAVHRRMAVDAFNQTWRLMDKSNRTADEDLTMIHMAHASRFHWGVVGQPVHWARGEWQVSRVYAMLGRAESALFHAEKCLGYVNEHSLSEFDLAAANEALTRAHLTSGDRPSAKETYEAAWNAAKRVVEPEDRAVLFADLHEHADVLGVEFRMA